MSVKNPLDLAGPNAVGNHVQVDYRVPPVNVAVASSPVGTDVLTLNFTKPPVKYSQPGTGFPF
jgi:hypothetical protein